MIVRYGVSSRYLAHYIAPGLDLPQSPLNGLSSDQIRRRLPDLLAFVLHYTDEPARSFENGWLSEDDLELLGWLATAPFSDWRWFGKAEIPPEVIPTFRYRAPAIPHLSQTATAFRNMGWSVLRLQAETMLSGQSAYEPTPMFGDSFHFGFVTSRGRDVEGRSMLVLSYKDGVSLVRYQRFDAERGEYRRLFMHVSPAVMDLLLRRLARLDLADIPSDTHGATADAPMYSFHLDGQETQLAFDFFGPMIPGTRYWQLSSILDEFVDVLKLDGGSR
jgi:hypothetical protein